MADGCFQGFHGYFYPTRVDVQVASLKPAKPIGCDDSASVFEDCEYAFCKHPMTSDEIMSRYGVRLKPNAVNKYPDETLPGVFGNTDAKTQDNVRVVYYGYFLPSAKNPNGRR